MIRIQRYLALIAALLCSSAFADERMLVKEVTVRAPLAAVWNAWTTEEGLEFVSGRSNIELSRGGAYEWFIDGPADERGKRGGQGAKVLAYLPMEMLAFSWTFPPDIPDLRNAGETTQVVVTFAEEGDRGVRVRLTAHEWQDSDSWDAGYAYFDEAWGYVLQALKTHLEAESQQR